MFNYANIKPDTSLYPRYPERAVALAKVVQAAEAGKATQGRFIGETEWSENGWALSDPRNADYRVKPEPVVETKREWVVITNIGRVDDSVQQTREAALRVAARYAGEVSIEAHYVTFTDGVETKREVRRA